MPPASDVEADPGHRFGGRDAGLLQVAHVERHAADVRGRDPVDERRRQLRLRRRHERQRLGTPPVEADRRRDVGETRHHDGNGEPRPVGRAERVEAVVDVGQLRQQEVEGAGERGDHHERPRPHPHEPLERFRFQPRRLADLVASSLSIDFDARRRVAAVSASGCRNGVAAARSAARDGTRAAEAVAASGADERRRATR